MRRNNRGFTLIELLLVVAIMFVILMLTMPALMTVRRKALIVTCQSNMRQINLLMEMYRQENDEIIPYLFYASEGMLDPEHMRDPETNVPGLAWIVMAYEHAGFTRDILRCPADTGYGGVDYGLTPTGLTCFGCFGQSYAYNNRLYTDPSSPFYDSGQVRYPEVRDKADSLIMLTDFSPVWHGVLGKETKNSKYFLNIMYFDGHIEQMEFDSDEEAERYRTSRSGWWK